MSLSFCSCHCFASVCVCECVACMHVQSARKIAPHRSTSAHNHFHGIRTLPLDCLIANWFSYVSRQVTANRGAAQFRADRKWILRRVGAVAIRPLVCGRDGTFYDHLNSRATDELSFAWLRPCRVRTIFGEEDVHSKNLHTHTHTHPQ